MSEALILALFEYGYTAAQIGLERVAAFDVLQARTSGVPPERMPEEVRKLRDEQIAANTARVNALPG